VLRKREDDGFTGTDLGALLEQHEVGAVAIAGLLSEMCVAATARAAMSRGLRVVLPRGAHGTYDIPPDGNGGVAVPAAQVARVAEWSLGDDVVIVNAVADVRFSASRVPQIDVEGESRCS
jgi:nicotinamidase-related amidase